MDSQERILVVIDDYNLRLTLTLILERAGYVAISACDAAFARHLLQNTRFDLIILDIKTQECGCMELLDQIQEQAPIPPALIMTGFNSWDNSIETQRNGTREYLLKPMDPELILFRVQNYFSKNRQGS